MQVEVAHLVGGFIAAGPMLLGAAGIYWKQQTLRRDVDENRRDNIEEFKRVRETINREKSDILDQMNTQTGQLREQFDINALKEYIRQDVRENRDQLQEQIERNRTQTMERVNHLQEQMANVLIMNTNSVERLAGIESRFDMLLQMLGKDGK